MVPFCNLFIERRWYYALEIINKYYLSSDTINTMKY